MNGSSYKPRSQSEQQGGDVPLEHRSQNESQQPGAERKAEICVKAESKYGQATDWSRTNKLTTKIFASVVNEAKKARALGVRRGFALVFESLNASAA